MKINFNFKKILKWIVFIVLLLVVLLIIIIKLFPSEFKQIPIPEPKVLETNKWQVQGKEMVERKYTFYGLNGLGYYQKELTKEQQKPAHEQNSSLITLLQHRLNTQQEPSDILPFAKQPFKEWLTDYGQYAFSGATFSQAVRGSILELYIKYMRCEEATGECWFSYKGPQYLLEEDKDYYIGNAELPYDPNNQIGPDSTKTYHLHFNPVRKTLSVYTEKFNVK